MLTMDSSTPTTSDRAVWDATAQRDLEAAAQWAEVSLYADRSGLRRSLRRPTAKGVRRGRSSSATETSPAYRSESRHHGQRNLKSVQAICSRHAWYSRKGKFDTLNSSRLLLPEPFPVHVVALDATAGQWRDVGASRQVIVSINRLRPRTPAATPM